MSQRPARRAAAASTPPTPPTSDSEAKHAGAEAVIYEPFLYDLSPTWDAWCFLRVADVHALVLYHDMGDHSAYFYGNLPIRWARVVGVVVGVDTYLDGKRLVYTLDDSSGACIECVLESDGAKNNAFGNTTSTTSGTTSGASGNTAGTTSKTTPGTTTGTTSKITSESFTPGTVVEVKARVITYRHTRQLRIVSIRCVECTAHEIALWNKRTAFMRTILTQRWVVDEAHVRRRQRRVEECRAEGRRRLGGGDAKKKRRERERGGKERQEREDRLAERLAGGESSQGVSRGLGRRNQTAHMGRNEEDNRTLAVRGQAHAPRRVAVGQTSREKRRIELDRLEQELADRLCGDDDDDGIE